MAKDAGGHGSEARGGGSGGALSRDDLAKQVAFTKAAGENMTEHQKAWLMSAQDRLNYGKGEPRVGGPGMKGAAMGSDASNYWAAKSLASGPKSAPVATHPAMTSRPMSADTRARAEKYASDVKSNPGNWGVK